MLSQFNVKQIYEPKLKKNKILLIVDIFMIDELATACSTIKIIRCKYKVFTCMRMYDVILGSVHNNFFQFY